MFTYIQACLHTKQFFFWCFDAGLEHMASRSAGNGTNFDWLRKSCDVSTCDLSPDGNPEKYGRPMKSAILLLFFLPSSVRCPDMTEILFNGIINHNLINSNK